MLGFLLVVVIAPVLGLLGLVLVFRVDEVWRAASIHARSLSSEQQYAEPEDAGFLLRSPVCVLGGALFVVLSVLTAWLGALLFADTI